MRKFSKRILSVLIALMMLFVMTACGDDAGKGKNENNDQSTAAMQATGDSGSNNADPGTVSAEEVTLQLSLESDKNLAFSKYDMNVYLDGQSLCTLKNGEKYSATLTVSKGSHELKFCKADEESMSSVETISLDSSKAISYFVKHDRNSIDISRTETKDIAETQGSTVTESATTEKATEATTAEPTTEAPTEEPTTEPVTEEPTTEEETEPSTEELTTSASNNGVPVIVGVSFETINSVCEELGIKQAADQPYSSDSDILRLRLYQDFYCSVAVIYYTETMEVLHIVFSIPDPDLLGGTWPDTMEKLVNSISPANSTASVLEWIEKTKGETEASAEINGYIYEISKDKDFSTFSYGIRHPELYNWAIENGVVETSEEETEDPSAGPKIMEKVKTNGLDYTTNDEETAKVGNTGKYAYMQSHSNYDIYYIIDFDGGYVYRFLDGNGADITCEKVKIVSGNLNKRVIIRYHDGGDTWENALYFRIESSPKNLVVEDHNNYQDFYKPVDINVAISILNTKLVHEY